MVKLHYSRHGSLGVGFQSGRNLLHHARHGFVAAVLALAMAVPAGTAGAATPPLGQADLDYALEMERKIADNIWFGQVYEIDYAQGAERTRANITSVNHFGDSALWTGTYLASQSFRYALAKKKLAGPLSTADRDLWKAQRDEAKARVKEMADKFHILVNISESWNHAFQPSTEQAGFGGGILNGEPGYLMRACNPVSAEPWQTWGDLGPDPTGMPRPYTANRRVFGPLKWRDGTEYFCEDGTSRDAYAGTTFGLLTAFDLVGNDIPGLRKLVGGDLITLTNFAFKYLWNTPRPHGRISIPIDSNHQSPTCSQINAIIRVCGHDFENFLSPLFVITPFARMNMAQAAHHVSAKLGGTDAVKWQLVWLEELLTQGPALALSMEFDAIQPYESYYKHNLSHLIGFNITRTAPNAAARALFHQAVGVMDHSTGDDINAHFEAITYSLTGETSRRDAAITHLREWRDYRARIESEPTTTNACGGAIECVPEDQYELVLADGSRVVIPGMSTDLRAREPIPVADRPPTDFLWQRAPNQLNGSEALTHQTPGIDYLLPYWMLRYYTEVKKPADAPFPPWPLPAHA
jgi:hypothetical protein